MTNEELMAKLAELQRENEALKAAKTAKAEIVVTDYGYVGVTGLSWKPIAHTTETWESLSRLMPEILKATKERKNEMDVKKASADAKRKADKLAVKAATDKQSKLGDLVDNIVNKTA